MNLEVQLSALATRNNASKAKDDDQRDEELEKLKKKKKRFFSGVVGSLKWTHLAAQTDWTWVRSA